MQTITTLQAAPSIIIDAINDAAAKTAKKPRKTRVTSLPLPVLSAKSSTEAAVIVDTVKNQHSNTVKTSLLTTLQAMDGDRSARADVALPALHHAYTIAIKTGNVSQLHAVITSTGKKLCEKAMRTAIQQIGVGIKDGVATGKGLSTESKKIAGDNNETLDGYIDRLVMEALAIFVSIACKEKAPKKEKELTPEQQKAIADNIFRAPDNKPVAAPVAAPVAMVASESILSKEQLALLHIGFAEPAKVKDVFISLIETGFFTNDELDDIKTAISSLGVALASHVVSGAIAAH